MPMDDDETLISYVRAIAATKKTPCAVYYDPKDGKVFAVGIDGKAEHETAIITAVMPNREEDTTKNWRFRVYASYTPTNSDIGLAWRADVGTIVYVDDKTGKICWFETRNPNKSTGYAVKEGFPKPFGAVSIEGVESLLDDKDLFKKDANYAGFLEKLKPLQAKSPLVKTLLAEGAKPCSSRVTFPHLRALIRNTTAKKDIVSLRPKGKLDTDQNAIDASYSRLVYALVSRAWLEKAPKVGIGSRAYGNNIGCLLTNKQNEIIAWGLNYKSLNANFHAETCMIQEYLYLTNANKLPEGCTMYTSLESCYMCAGFFADVAPKGRCIYLQEDPQVPGSALDRGVNGCKQFDATKLSVPSDMVKEMGTLSDLKKSANTDTITFLFSADARKKYELELNSAHEAWWEALTKGDPADAPTWTSSNCLLFLHELWKIRERDPVMKQIDELRT